MKLVPHIFALLLLGLVPAYGQQMTIISSAPKDPDIKPEQRTANIVHYEKVRAIARGSIRVLALALQNTDPGPSRLKLNEAINNEEDMVDWANWCILALRDKTDDAKTCVFQPEVR